MSYDLALVLGIVIAGFSIPAIVSAFSDSRAPRAASLMVLMGAVLLLGPLWKSRADTRWIKYRMFS